MLSLDFAEIAIIEIIATARIMAAIVPNSGITKVPIISICSAPAKNGTVTVLPLISASSDSSPSTNTIKIPVCVDVEGLIVNVPSSSASMLMITELSFVFTVALITCPPEISYDVHASCIATSFEPL